MASLSITSLSFDKAAYNPGDIITLTVDYTTDDSTAAATSFETAVTATDADGTATQSGPFTVNGAAEPMPVTVTATDNRPSPGTWTLASNVVTGTGPWSGIAVLTSVA